MNKNPLRCRSRRELLSERALDARTPVIRHAFEARTS
jgi:hypothetical protein